MDLKPKFEAEFGFIGLEQCKFLHCRSGFVWSHPHCFHLCRKKTERRRKRKKMPRKKTRRRLMGTSLQPSAQARPPSALSAIRLSTTKSASTAHVSLFPVIPGGFLFNFSSAPVHVVVNVYRPDASSSFSLSRIVFPAKTAFFFWVFVLFLPSVATPKWVI